jgi:hypothetical protein
MDFSTEVPLNVQNMRTKIIKNQSTPVVATPQKQNYSDIPETSREIINPFDEAPVPALTETHELNTQIDELLNKFRQKLRSSSESEVPPDIPEMQIPTLLTFKTFTDQGLRLYKEESVLLQSLLSSSFTQCLKPGLLTFLKLIYFKGQADMFTTNVTADRIKYVVSNLEINMANQLVDCMQQKTNNLVKFHETFEIDRFTNFITGIANANFVIFKEQCATCKKTTRAQLTKFLKLKEHVHGLALKSWKEYIHKVQDHFDIHLGNLILEYRNLMSEYYKIMAKITEFTPEGTNDLLDLLLFEDDVTLENIQGVLDQSSLFFFLKPQLTENGPTMLCEFLKKLNKPCLELKISANNYDSLNVILKKTAQIYNEYKNKLFQINMKANIAFKSTVSTLSCNLGMSIQKFGSIQHRLNILITKTFGQHTSYPKVLDMLYASEIIKETHGSLKLLLEHITMTTSQDFTFLYFSPI